MYTVLFVCPCLCVCMYGLLFVCTHVCLGTVIVCWNLCLRAYVVYTNGIFKVTGPRSIKIIKKEYIPHTRLHSLKFLIEEL